MGTLAPLGEYHWTCGSFSPPESTTQTENRLVQPFLHSSRLVSSGILAPPGEYYWNFAHLSYPANTIELVLPLAHLSPQPKRQIDWFGRFCTAHSRKSVYFTMGDSFPKIAPSHGGSGAHLTRDSLGPSEPTTQTASRSVQPFLHRWPQCPCTLHRFPPQNCPFQWGSGPPFNTCFPGPTRVVNPNSILIGSAGFAGLTSVTDRPVGDNRLHLRWRCSLIILSAVCWHHVITIARVHPGSSDACIA